MDSDGLGISHSDHGQRSSSSTTPSAARTTAMLTRNELACIQATVRQPGQEHPQLHLISFGVAESAGTRPYMEDRHQILPTLPPIHSGIQLAGPPVHKPLDTSYAAVFDGHSGIDAAEMAAARLHVHIVSTPSLQSVLGGGFQMVGGDANERVVGKALQKAFVTMDEEILSTCRQEPGIRCSGSTALVALRLGHHLYVANAGDCRAVLCRDGRPVRLTAAHHPEVASERQRIEREGGCLAFQNGWRVIMENRDGLPKRGVRVSRGLGDLHFKEPARLVDSRPDVRRTQLEPSDAFLILGTDGVWSTVKDELAIEVVAKVLKEQAAAGAPADTAAAVAAKTLVLRALDRGCMDNATAVVMVLDWAAPAEGGR